MRDNLSLSVTGNENLSIAAFGSTKEALKKCVVCISVHTRTGENREVDLLVVPHICDPLVRQNVEHCLKTYEHLANLDLADIPQGNNLQVDMLIGSDLYWQFVTGEVLCRQEGPVVVGTTLGWVLSRPAELPERTVSLAVTHTLHVGGITNKELDVT